VSGGSDTQEAGAAPVITMLGGNPTTEELAAVTAVITGVLEELADEHSRAAAVGQSAWQRSQRPLRGRLQPGFGAWRSFSG
jgi:hypothetical protein